MIHNNSLTSKHTSLRLSYYPTLHLLTLLTCASLLTACGGSGGSSSNGGNPSGTVSSSVSTASSTSSTSEASSTSSSISSSAASSSSSSSSSTASSSSSASSSTSSQSSPTTLTLGGANALLRQKLINDAPHVANTGIVLGTTRQTPADTKARVNVLQTAQPAAGKTLDLNLSVIWDPQNGSAPQSGNFAVTNLYNGGALTCSSASNTCSDGLHTISMAESLVNYMSQSLDPSFSNSNGDNTTLFGRFLKASSILCAFSQIALPNTLDSDGLPMIRSYTIKFPADTANNIYQPYAQGGCDVSVDLAGTSTVATVTNVSSTNFTKKMSLATVDAAVTIWLKLDNQNGVYNLMEIEDQRVSGFYAVKRTVAYMSGLSSAASSKIVAEHINIGSVVADATSCIASTKVGPSWRCGFDYDRVLIDEHQDIAYSVTNAGRPGADDGSINKPDYYVQYTAAGSPLELAATCGGSKKCINGTLAISFTAGGQKFPTDSSIYPSAFYDYNGCVDFRTKLIVTDGSLNCDVAGQSVLMTGGAASMIEQTRQRYVTDVMATLLSGTNENTTLPFSSANDIYSAVSQ